MMQTLKNHTIHFLIFFLAIVLYLVTMKPVFVRRGSALERMFTHAANLGVALRDAGFAVSPAASGELESAVAWGSMLAPPDQPAVEFVVAGETRRLAAPGNGPFTIQDLLDSAGITLAGDERVLADGVPMAAEAILLKAPQRLEIRTVVGFTVKVDGSEKQYEEIGPSVGEALWEAGLRVNASDLVTPPLATELAGDAGPLTIEIIRGRALTVTADGQDFAVTAAGKTIGEALAQAGFALNGLDYSKPDENQPLPADGRIQVVRVREEYLREQEPIPFERKTQLVSTLELDQTQLVQPGIYGILERTVRVRYEDGVEVSRTPQGEQVLVPPQDRITGYGTQAVIRTMDTPDGPVEYYRAVRVYATSYYCGIINGKCNFVTTSGKQLARGMIAMVWSWYYLFKGQGVYVPDYGTATVEDVVPGTDTSYWIDLALPGDAYKAWHQYTTLYFLTPVPPNVPAILP